MKPVLLALLLAAPAFAAPEAAKPTAAEAPAKPVADLDALLGAFRAVDGLEARFTEEKRMALLAAPLVSAGALYYARPGHLRRQIETPRPAVVVIGPETLWLKDERGTETIDLAARRDVAAFAESLVLIFAGDRARLEATYTIAFEPAADGWKLSLTPKVEPLSKLVSAIHITGRGPAVETIRVAETSGDETITRIESADPTRRFDAAERAKLFGPPQ